MLTRERVEIRTPSEIDAMAEAGSVVAECLRRCREAAVADLASGISPRRLDDVAAQVISDRGAQSCYIGYHPQWAPSPYPAVTCISVNDVVVHAIPNEVQLVPGDLVSVDIAVLVDGWAADAAISFHVGDADPAEVEMIATARRSLDAGIENMRRV